MPLRVKLLYGGQSHSLGNVRPTDLMLGLHERIAQVAGIPVDDQWLKLDTIEKGAGEGAEATVVVKVEEKPAVAPNIMSDFLYCAMMCALLALGFQYTQTQTSLVLAKPLQATIFTLLLCGLPILCTGLLFTRVNPVTGDLLKVTDALFGELTERQVASLTMARFSEDKILRPRGTEEARGDGSQLAPFDTIVIGSGVGGCTAASIHAQSGNRVLLLEQNERFGGCTHSFTIGSKANECEFDTGLHYVSSEMAYESCRSGAIQRFITRGHQKFVDLGSPYDIVTFREDEDYPRNDKCPNEFDFRFFSNEDRLIDGILENINSSKEARALLRPRLKVWFSIVKEAADTMPFAWIMRLLPSYVHALAKMFLEKAKRFNIYGGMTTKDVQWAVFGLGWTKEQILTQKVPKAPEWSDVEAAEGSQLKPEEAESLWPSVCRICAVVTHPIGDYACQPRDSSMLAHSLTADYYMNGAAYTIGHTQGISTSVLRSIYASGGQAFCRATVERIIVEPSTGRAIGVSVRQSGTEKEPVDIYVRSPDRFAKTTGHGDIICATSIYNLYHKMLPKQVCEKQIKAFNDSYTAEPSYGHTYLFVRLDKEVKTTAVNTWYFGDFDLDRAFDEYFAEPEKYKPPTVYIGFPSMKDVTWRERYPGCKSALLIADAKWSWFEPWWDTKVGARGDDYEAFKEKLSQRLLEVLYTKVPGTKDHVTDYWLGTPLTDSGYLGSYQGGSYGTRCNIRYFAENNLKYIMRSDTEFPGLHLAGSDAFCPAVAGAQYGGLMCGMNSISFLQRCSVARQIFMHQSHAIKDIVGCSPIRAFMLACASNLNWIPPIWPTKRNLRPCPPFCTDDPNDAELFLQKEK